MQKIYLASDHAGFELKAVLKQYIDIGIPGFETEDLGTHDFNAEDDYPDFVMPCAARVAAEPESFGIILGKSGQGEAMAANRVHGARTGVFYGGSLEIVQLLREHNNANILSLGAGFLSQNEAQEAIRVFLSTPFSNDPRHTRRLEKF